MKERGKFKSDECSMDPGNAVKSACRGLLRVTK